MKRRTALGVFVLIALITLLAGCHDGYSTYSFGYGTGHVHCPPAHGVAVYSHHGHHDHHHGHGCHY